MAPGSTNTDTEQFIKLQKVPLTFLLPHLEVGGVDVWEFLHRVIVGAVIVLVTELAALRHLLVCRHKTNHQLTGQRGGLELSGPVRGNKPASSEPARTRSVGLGGNWRRQASILYFNMYGS